MTKKLRKEVVTRSGLRDKIAHTRTGQTIKNNVTFARIF